MLCFLGIQYKASHRLEPNTCIFRRGHAWPLLFSFAISAAFLLPSFVFFFFFSNLDLPKRTTNYVLISHLKVAQDCIRRPRLWLVNHSCLWEEWHFTNSIMLQVLLESLDMKSNGWREGMSWWHYMQLFLVELDKINKWRFLSKL